MGNNHSRTGGSFLGSNGGRRSRQSQEQNPLTGGSSARSSANGGGGGGVHGQRKSVDRHRQQGGSTVGGEHVSQYDLSASAEKGRLQSFRTSTSDAGRPPKATQRLPSSRGSGLPQLAEFDAVSSSKDEGLGANINGDGATRSSTMATSRGSLSTFSEFLNIDDCSVCVAIRRVSSMNRFGLSDTDGKTATSAGDGSATEGSDNGDKATNTGSEKGRRDSSDRPPMSINDAKNLFEVIFNPAEGELECVKSEFISRDIYCNLSHFINPFLENDPYRKKWFVDNTMRVVIGHDRWRSTREPEIVATPNKEQIRQLIQLRRDYTDLLREKLLEMAGAIEGPSKRRKKTSFREQVAMFNAGKEAARMAGTYGGATAAAAAAANNSNSSRNNANLQGYPNQSPYTTATDRRSSENSYGHGSVAMTSMASGASQNHFGTGQRPDTEYDVIMTRLTHASATSFDCCSLLAKRIPTLLLTQVPLAYWMPETPVVWSKVGCTGLTVSALEKISFFVPLSRRVALLQEGALRMEKGKLTGFFLRAEHPTLSSSSGSNGEALIDSPATLFTAARNLGLVLTTACSSMVLQVLIDLADTVKLRQSYRHLKQQARSQNVRLEDLVGSEAASKPHIPLDPQHGSIGEWKESAMMEKMTLPTLTQLLVRRFYERAENKGRMARLTKDYMNVFAFVESSSKNEEFVPTRALGSIVLKLMFLLGGGQRTIESDDRRVPSGARQSTDDLSLAHMLEVPVLNYICWTACLLGMPVMSPKGSLLQKRSERPLSFIEADEIAGVMRVLFQEVGALPAGNACPHNFTEWLPLFPLYAVNTEGKRTLMYIYSIKACPVRPMPLVIQKDMVLQSYAAIITESMKGFNVTQLKVNVNETIEEINEVNETGIHKLLTSSKKDEKEIKNCFQPNTVLSYLWQPTMTTGYAKTQKEAKLITKKTHDSVALPPLSKSRAVSASEPLLYNVGSTPSSSGHNRSATKVSDLREPANFRFDGPNHLLMSDNTSNSSEEAAALDVSSSAKEKPQPLTVKALAAMNGQQQQLKQHTLSQGGRPTRDDDKNGSESSDGNSSNSTLLDPRMNIDVYTCVSPVAQLYLRCTNEAIVKRHKSTELTPFVSAELFRDMAALQPTKPDLYFTMLSYLKTMSKKSKRDEVKVYGKDVILLLHWTSAEPMVTFQPGDILSLIVDRPGGGGGGGVGGGVGGGGGGSGSSRYFNNMPRRSSQGNTATTGSVADSQSSGLHAREVFSLPHSTASSSAHQNLRNARKPSVTIDAADPDNGSSRSVKRTSRGFGELPVLTSAEAKYGRYWSAANVNLEDSWCSTEHSGSYSSSYTKSEERPRGTMSISLTVKAVSDASTAPEQHRSSEVFLLLHAPTTQLPESSRIMGFGHQRANLSPFFYMEGDKTMCWTNTRLIASIAASYSATVAAAVAGLLPADCDVENGNWSGKETNNPMMNMQPCGYSGEQLKRIFYSVGVLLANAITNAVFFSIPMAPLCFSLLKKALQTGDHSYNSFTWLEPCDGNLLSPPMVLNAAYDIMNLSDRAYLDFLTVRGLVKPDSLTFPLMRRHLTPGSATTPKPPQTPSSASFKRSASTSVSRASTRDVDGFSSTCSATTNTLPEMEALMRDCLDALGRVNRGGSANPSGHENAAAGLASANGGCVLSQLLTASPDVAELRRVLDTLPSREEYIALYLVSEIAWGSASKNSFGGKVRELWGWMAKGFMTSPIARSPLMTHCCSRVIREVLCMPISGKKGSNEG